MLYYTRLHLEEGRREEGGGRREEGGGRRQGRREGSGSGSTTVMY
jgi:hypothetical protein